MNRKKGLLRTAVILLLFALIITGLDSRLKTVTYEIVTDELKAPVRLAVLTDLHSCAYGEGQAELLRAVTAEQPDAILMAGDIVDDVMPEENAWIMVSALAEVYPCYYVTGNHEWWSGEAERICDDMEAVGVTVLQGACETIAVNENDTTVCGVDDPDSGMYENQLELVGEKVRADGFHILLSHRPERIEDYLEYPFDLILSGHAHGGQWRMPGIINGLYAPNQGLFPRYAGGRYDFDSTVFLVSRGLARESTKIPRVFNRPELVVVDLIPA